ncbi:hypothetical protein GQ53DRAFT_742743 [Thozetella sp. PMI_491]|nr:hypothetical protein GQ53DRAFT_742743 [Thozetella sp. PMI_491]
MRYSRFRAQMLGIEPQKRKRDPNRTRVTKKRKDDKPGARKDECSAIKQEQRVKQEPIDPDSTEETSRPSTAAGAGPSKQSPKVKAEPSLGAAAAAQTSRMESSPAPSSVMSTACVPVSMAELHSQLNPRLLTPCSDSDVIATSQGFNPSGDIFAHAEPAIDFGSPATHVHDTSMWHGIPSPTFGGFTIGGYGLESYGIPFCDHPQALEEQRPNHHQGHGHGDHSQMHHSAGGHMGIPAALMDHDPSGHAMVKHEDWDSQLSPFHQS